MHLVDRRLIIRVCVSIAGFYLVGRRLTHGYYDWMNSKAMAEGRRCNGYLCYEAVGAAACMA